MKTTADILKITIEDTKKLFWFLGLHAFSVIIFFIFVDVIFGGFVFYQYVYLAEKAQLTTVENIIRFNSNNYQNVLQELQSRESNEQPAGIQVIDTPVNTVK